MPLISIYATVYNNAYIVEQSVRSLIQALPDFDENYELVVVDNFSTDGTWEKLQKLKKQHRNIRLYRHKCSRGLGRDIALKLTEGDYVMYVDLDVLFKPEFGKIVEKIRRCCSSGELWNFGFSVRETMLHHIGGWKDLNFGEDWELVYRAIRNKVALKLILTYSFMENVRIAPSGYAEMRYVRGRLEYYMRRLRNLRDTVIGWNLSPAYAYYIEGRLRPSVFLFVLISSIYSLKRLFSGDFSLIPAQVYACLAPTYYFPEDVGLPRSWLFLLWERIDAFWSYISESALSLIKKSGDAYMVLLPASRCLAVFRDKGVVKDWIKQALLQEAILSGGKANLNIRPISPSLCEARQERC